MTAIGMYAAILLGGAAAGATIYGVKRYKDHRRKDEAEKLDQPEDYSENI